ncbi:uncharacterized protein LOC120840624 [Ixodes scapularis]|uniref:uncharacterized protein LOC120840624 n=1 Tax=Ixodes scapularis TaxID=6945 RepID=UPI001A9E6AAE|nr:uncharacterized protein LOC120840624 [Ixodes scapularis]
MGHIGLGIVYMATAGVEEFWNERIYKCLEKDLEECNITRLIILMGDFNCHLAELSSKDERAHNLRKLVKHSNLRIVNLEEGCKGQITWSRGNQQSTINYILASQDLFCAPWHLQDMTVDEEKVFSCGSDNNRIKITIDQAYKKFIHSSRKHKLHRRTSYWRTSDEGKMVAWGNALDAVFARSPPSTYSEFYESLMQLAYTHVAKQTRVKSDKRTPWFDKKVKEEIKVRQEWYRKHRKAMNKKQYSMAKQNWENYELQKNKVKSLVATKILKILTKHEQALQESDNKSRRFWRYVRSLQPHEDLEHKTVGSGEDQWTTEEEITEGMTRYFKRLQASLYNRPRTQEETSLRPQERFDRSILEPIAPGEQQRHINKLEAGKAVGPDDIPNELLKKLKPVAQKHLRYLLNNMLAKSDIPEAWKQAQNKTNLQRKR